MGKRKRLAMVECLVPDEKLTILTNSWEKVS